MSTIYLDVESTGTEPLEDRIVEVAMVVDRPHPEREGTGQRFTECRRHNPGVPIPEEAAAVHGITNEDVADEEPFSYAAPYYQKLLDDADVLVGFNLRAFDCPMLDAELQRAGHPGIDLEAVREVDLYRLWLRWEDRTLETAVDRFLGHELTDAHSAEADAQVLEPLLTEMSRHYGRDPYDLEALAEASVPDHEVDRSGKLVRVDGQVCFAFGKHRGEPVREHPEYADWVLGADFPADTKAAVREELEVARAHA